MPRAIAMLESVGPWLLAIYAAQGAPPVRRPLIRHEVRGPKAQPAATYRSADIALLRVSENEIADEVITERRDVVSDDDKDQATNKTRKKIQAKLAKDGSTAVKQNKPKKKDKGVPTSGEKRTAGRSQTTKGGQTASMGLTGNGKPTAAQKRASSFKRTNEGGQHASVGSTRNSKSVEVTTKKGGQGTSVGSTGKGKRMAAEKNTGNAETNNKVGQGASVGSTGDGNPVAAEQESTGSSKTTNSANWENIPTAYRKDVRSPNVTGPGTAETARLLDQARSDGQTIFGLFSSAKYSDCARSIRLRTFLSWSVIDLSETGCKDGTILKEGEGHGRFAGSMKFCVQSSGTPMVTMYNQPGCPEGNAWQRTLAISGPQMQGILDQYCLQVWAGGWINAQMVNYKMSTGSMASC